jgi:hypothetical protein
MRASFEGKAQPRAIREVTAQTFLVGANASFLH